MAERFLHSLTNMESCLWSPANMCWEEGVFLAMAEAALALDFLILVMIFSRLLSRESVEAPAVSLTTLVMGSATSSWNSLCSWLN